MSDFGGAVRQTEDYDFAILGIPFDEKSCYLRGAAKGPQAVRAASTGEAINAWTELGVDLSIETRVTDQGDMDVSGGFEAVFSRIQDRVTRILERKAFPVVLGGDHSITYPVVKSMAGAFKPLDILHFDAHPDLYDELYGDRFSHACPFARILEDGLAQNLVQVGIRAATAEQRQKAARYGVRMIEMKDLDTVPELSFTNPLYLSVDMDSLDPAFAPGVSHHEPGGLSTRQLLQIIHRLRARMVGMDLVEVNADRDRSGITAAAGAKIVMEVMGKVVHDLRGQPDR